jgi:hypothetical protein
VCFDDAQFAAIHHSYLVEKLDNEIKATTLYTRAIADLKTEEAILVDNKYFFYVDSWGNTKPNRQLTGTDLSAVILANAVEYSLWSSNCQDFTDAIIKWSGVDARRTLDELHRQRVLTRLSEESALF